MPEDTHRGTGGTGGIGGNTEFAAAVRPHLRSEPVQPHDLVDRPGSRVLVALDQAEYLADVVEVGQVGAAEGPAG